MTRNICIEERLSHALLSMQGLEGTRDVNHNWEAQEAQKLRPAAVLLAFKRGSGSLLLTRRSDQLKHHPGQIACPGGKYEEDDQTLIKTALREAQEEIGLLIQDTQVLGIMPTHVTISRFLVTPVIALIPDTVTLTPEDGEVSEIFELPFEQFSQSDTYQAHHRLWQGRRRKYYAAPYGPHYIWGATANILKTLCDHLP